MHTVEFSLSSLAAFAFTLLLEGDAIVQSRAWANTRLPHRLKHPDITELEQRACYFKGPLTLHRDEEQIRAEPTLAELLIWPSLGFPKWCAQIFAHIVEFTPASALENV